jgi:hypothetical protein
MPAELPGTDGHAGWLVYAIMGHSVNSTVSDLHKVGNANGHDAGFNRCRAVPMSPVMGVLCGPKESL